MIRSFCIVVVFFKVKLFSLFDFRSTVKYKKIRKTHTFSCQIQL